MTTDTQTRIAHAIRECGNGPTVRDDFFPFTDLLRELASDENIAAFAEACRQMFLSSRPNQWSIRDDAPTILFNYYLPKFFEPRHLSWSGLVTNASSWHKRLADVLDSPTDLQSVLDAIVAEIKQSASSPC